MAITEELKAAQSEVIAALKEQFGEDATFVLCVGQLGVGGFNSIARQGAPTTHALWALQLQHDVASEQRPVNRIEG